MAKRKKVRAKSNVEILASIRNTWEINPVTKVEDNARVYSRRKLKKQLRKEYLDYPRALEVTRVVEYSRFFR